MPGKRVLGAITLSSTFLFCHAAPPSALPSVPPLTVATEALPDTPAAPFPASGPNSGGDGPTEEEMARFKSIDTIVEAAIEGSKMPGCVIMFGRHDQILFQKAYGSRSLVPERTPMTTDTVFDLASLTKSVATSTSLMLLVDRGQVDLDARASIYVPELANMPPFTVRQLLIHTSGLPAGTPMRQWSRDRAEVIRNISQLTLKSRPGEEFNYSDVGFVVLQEIIQRVSGKPLEAFTADEVFAPLGMKETGYLPPPELRARAAPTEQRDGGIIQGEVHDPRAYALGGVGGHAGVFSTARDLSRFARMMLERGVLKEGRLVSDKTFERFITRHETPKGGRALGWDVDSTYATHKGTLFSPRAFGHGGFTGTAMWIDPDKDMFLVFLSNRVHPDGKGAVNPLIGEIATAAVNSAAARTGVDVLSAESFARLSGAKVGLIANLSSKALDGTPTIQLFKRAPNLTLGAILTPEHGLGADKEGHIADNAYEGIPVRSLYGQDKLSPAEADLAGIDTLVFDLQDVGMRFYTYASTMKRAMKVAADRKMRFVVLDRPNPIGGVDVQGPVLPADSAELKKSFVNHHPLPLRHGMTIGELALLFAEDEGLPRPEVVKVVGWRRRDTFERTGLTWSSPSPNLRSLAAVMLYPAIGLLESTNVSVGRGTDIPFEVVAAPWMDAEAVAKKLTLANVAGVSFETTEVTPKSAVHANKKCKGIRVRVTDKTSFEPIRTGLVIASTLHEVHPSDWDMDAMDRMLRSKPALAAIRAGKGLADIESTWASELGAFKARREQFLLYK